VDDARRFWREGVTAGLIGAAGVAGWFFIVDLVAGTVFATPDLLGRSLLSVLGRGASFSPMANVFAYTLFHVAAFVAVGCIVAWIVEASARTPGVLVGLLLFFVVFQAGFYGLTLFLQSATGLAQLAWYQIGIANLIASALMGWYLWRAHPELADRVEGALSARL
jgi:hypothetical protein